MAYLTIDEKTASGRKLIEDLRKRSEVKILRHPNEETKKALREAKSGKGIKPMGNVAEWFKKHLE